MSQLNKSNPCQKPLCVGFGIAILVSIPILCNRVCQEIVQRLDVSYKNNRLEEVNGLKNQSKEELRQTIKKLKDVQQGLEVLVKEFDFIRLIVQIEKGFLPKKDLLVLETLKNREESLNRVFAYTEKQKDFEQKQKQQETLQKSSERSQIRLEEQAGIVKSQGRSKDASELFKKSQKLLEKATSHLDKARFYLREAGVMLENARRERIELEKLNYAVNLATYKAQQHLRKLIQLKKEQQQYGGMIEKFELEDNKYQAVKTSLEKDIEKLDKEAEQLIDQIKELELQLIQTSSVFWLNLLLLIFSFSCGCVLLLYVTHPARLPHFLDEDMAGNIVEQRNKDLKENECHLLSIELNYLNEAIQALLTYHILIKLDNLTYPYWKQK